MKIDTEIIKNVLYDELDEWFTDKKIERIVDEMSHRQTIVNTSTNQDL